MSFHLPLLRYMWLYKVGQMTKETKRLGNLLNFKQRHNLLGLLLLEWTKQECRFSLDMLSLTKSMQVNKICCHLLIERNSVF